MHYNFLTRLKLYTFLVSFGDAKWIQLWGNITYHNQSFLANWGISTLGKWANVSFSNGFPHVRMKQWYKPVLRYYKKKAQKQNDNHYCDVIMGAMASLITGLNDCILNRLFRRRSKKTSMLRVTGLCEGNSPVTGEFPAQMVSNAENVDVIMITVSLSAGSPTSWSMCRWVQIRAAKMHKVSSAILTDLICFANVKRNQWNLSRQHISIFNHHCLCRWPTTVRCYDIRKCINAQIRITYIYGTGT